MPTELACPTPVEEPAEMGSGVHLQPSCVCAAMDEDDGNRGIDFAQRRRRKRSISPPIASRLRLAGSGMALATTKKLVKVARSPGVSENSCLMPIVVRAFSGPEIVMPGKPALAETEALPPAKGTLTVVR